MNVPRHWRLRSQRYRLAGSLCQSCGQVLFPPRPLCLDCATAAVPTACESPASEPIPWMVQPAEPAAAVLPAA